MRKDRGNISLDVHRTKWCDQGQWLGVVECKLVFFVDSFRKCFFPREFVLAALSQISFPFRRFVRIHDDVHFVHFVTQLFAARHAACLQSAVQLPAVSSSTVDVDPWRVLYK